MPNGGSGRPAARRSPAPGPSHPPRPPAAGNRLRRLPGGRRGRSGPLAPPPRRGWMWPRPRPSLLSYSAGRHSAPGRTTRPPAAGGEKGREPRPLPSAAAGLAVGIPSPPSPPLVSPSAALSDGGGAEGRWRLRDRAAAGSCSPAPLPPLRPAPAARPPRRGRGPCRTRTRRRARTASSSSWCWGTAPAARSVPAPPPAPRAPPGLLYRLPLSRHRAARPPRVVVPVELLGAG